MSTSFIHQSSSTKNNEASSDKYYCIIGTQDFIDNENNPRIKSESSTSVLAKIKFKDNGQPKYLIRLDSNKQLFNPSTNKEQNNKNKPIDLLLPNNSGFKEVSQKVFDFYLSFLRTLNTSWINHAEREDF